ncbi:MAG: SIMPL domain-containing protein [Pseudomonadota bacterium]
MDRLIEVVGSCRYSLKAKSFPVELTLKAGSTRASDRHELAKTMTALVAHLVDCGVDQEALADGGGSDERSYWRRKDVSKAVMSLRVELSNSGEVAQLQSHLGEFKPDGATLQVDTKAPEFEDDARDRAIALAEAVSDARASADAIAQAAGVEVLHLHSVRELNDAIRGSGYGEDHDWGEPSDWSPVMMAGGAVTDGGGGASAQGDVTSMRRVRVLARFQIT